MINLKKNFKIYIILISLILIIPLISSTTIIPYGYINSTVLSTTTSNLKINITSPIYAGFIIESSSIYIENLNLDNGFNTISFNMTVSNKNYTGFNLPYFYSLSDSSKKIISNITSVNSSINLNQDCTKVGRITYISANGVSTDFVNGLFTRDYTCSNNIVTFNSLIQIDQGINIFTISNDGGSITACQSSVSAFSSYIALLGLLGTIIFLALALSYLTGIIDKDRLYQIGIISTIVTLIMIAVLIIVAIFMFSTLCSVL